MQKIYAYKIDFPASFVQKRIHFKNTKIQKIKTCYARLLGTYLVWGMSNKSTVDTTNVSGQLNDLCYNGPNNLIETHLNQSTSFHCRKYNWQRLDCHRRIQFLVYSL